MRRAVLPFVVGILVLFGLGSALLFASAAKQQSAAVSAPQSNAAPRANVSCPFGRCEFVEGRVLVKLVANDVRGLNARTPADQQFASAGVAKLDPVFRSATRPVAGEFVISVSGERVPRPDLTQWYRATLREGTGVMAAVEALRQMPGVAVVEPDYLRRPIGALNGGTGSGVLARRFASVNRYAVGRPAAPDSLTFNDPLYAQQWHLAAAKIPETWAYLESIGLPPGGRRDIVVAVIDTGVDYTHPDLTANMWTNSREIPANGVDDDGDGFVDDVHGVDVITNSGNPMDDHGHGTHVAGIIGAQANNGIGVVGVAYYVQMMAIKAAQYSGVLAASDIAEGINYAVQHGADVINMSFGGYARSQLEEDALTVAFGQAVLVAAAGNDAKVNLPCPFGADMYPAAYNWVLGVMASTQSGGLASFSNYDCVPRDKHEYELMAPGVDIWSTLPNEQYGAWDGTSMAAPIVSGLAALVRTRFADKEVYSSRFIMGQIASNAAPVANGLGAVSIAPKPELKYLEHWLFDTTAQAAINDNDGRVDAGETIDLAIVIRNHWGKADQVSVKLEAWAEGAFQADPYVTMLVDTVDYGAIGSFNWDDNGLIYDSQGVITGVRSPFKFTVDPNTPNDHVIPFKITMTCRNGLDPADTTVYTFTSRFTLIVQRGRELPRIISSAMSLSKEYFWIVSGQTLIENGGSVTIEKGTKVQWGSPNPNDPYSTPATPYLQVEGTLEALGTLEEPVELFGSEILRSVVSIQTKGGVTNLRYVKVRDAAIGTGTYWQANLIDHGYFYGDLSGSISATVLSNSIVHRYSTDLQSHHLSSNLLEMRPRTGGQGFGSIGYYGTETVRDTVFLQSNVDNATWALTVGQMPHYASPSEAAGDNRIRANGFLSKYWDPDINHWMRVFETKTWCCAGTERTWYYGASGNYWGTTSRTVIDAAIRDFNDDFNLAHVVYEPILTSPAVTTYPFVADVGVWTSDGRRASVFGAELVTFTVTYNRDMDVTVEPQVSFGPDMPVTDYTVHPVNGGWQDARTWVGTFNVTPITGDGYQLIRVAGGRAADDHWLVAGDDSARFRFEIITSGTEAMNLQASGGEGYVDLTWTQNDFDLLSGFNLYRSSSRTGTFSRINQALIPREQRSFRDTNVVPGQPYYYKFTVVKSDMTESAFSNVATATPIDTIAPVITHTPVTTAPPGLGLSLSADVTDNVQVKAVSLYYRATNATAYRSLAMTKTTGNRYSATIDGSSVVSPGLDYYVEATDGISTTLSGRPEYPWQITVSDRPVVTAISPTHGPADGGTAVTIVGSNFKAGATVTIGGAACASLTVTPPNQIACTTPPHFPITADVVVTNPDSQSGVLLRAFTFESSTASISLPTTGGGQHAIVRVPVNAANLSGLAAADLTVSFDSTVLSARSVATGTLTPGWTAVANTGTAGQVRIALASGGGTVTGSGTLVLIDFDVVGAPGATTLLRLVRASLNDGAIAVQTADGSFTVSLVYTVSGTVRYWSTGTGVGGASLSLQGDRLYGGTSGVNGAYAISGVAAGAYTLVPGKADETNGITAYDASLVLQHSAGAITLTGAAAVVADVNRSGSITSMDAFYILQKAVDLITLPFPGAGSIWTFDPATRSYASVTTDQAGQDFTAVLIGDPSGNWSADATAPPRTLADAVSTTLALPAVAIRAGQERSIALSLEHNQAEVHALDLTITYDPTVISITDVRAGSHASDWLVSSKTASPGVLRAAAAGAAPVTGDGEVLTLTLRALGRAGTQTALTITAASLDEGRIQRALGAGQVRVVSTFGSDFNGDGKPDLVWRNRVTGEIIIWLMNGATLGSEVRLAGPSDRDWKIVAIADFNGDDTADLLWRSGATGENQIWYMDGTSHTSTAMVNTVSDVRWEIVAAADVNSDSKPDILWRNSANGDVVIWYMNGAAYAGYAWVSSIADPNWTIAAADDFNGDGKPDLLWRNRSTGQNVVWYMNGAQYVGFAWLETVSDVNWRIVGTGDFNADGKTDILWRNVLTGENKVNYMDGAQYVSSNAVQTVTNPEWDVLHSSEKARSGPTDFNADGYVDILWRNASTGENRIWYMNGATRVSEGTVDTESDLNWRSVAVADFNGDGLPDIVWRNAATGENKIWLMTGATHTGDMSLPTIADTNWRVVGVGDFNRDGHPDLAWRNQSTGANVIWFLVNGAYAGWTAPPTIADTNWQIVGVGDFNGDGWPDLFWRNQATGVNIAWFLVNGVYAGWAAPPTIADATWQIVGVADFNGDGKADLLWRNVADGRNLVWYLNNGAYVDFAWLPTLSTDWKTGPWQ
jgi:subtilisin family serine protease